MMFKFKNIFLFLYIFAILVFVGHLIYTKTAVYGDGRFYYAYLPSYILDHTLNFVKAFNHFGIISFKNLLGPANIYPIGPAIFWSIPFTIANLILIPFGKAVGYGPLYDIFIGLWNISFVFTGIFLLRKTLLKHFDQNLSNLASLGILTTTNLLFYGAVDVINSHSASFFFASVFLYLFTSKRTLLNSLLLGICIGLLTLIRSQDYLFLIFPLIEIVRNRKNILFSSITGVTALILFIPQIALWHTYYGGWLENPYLKVRSFDFFHPHLFGVLFNKDSGIIWTPIIFICIYGLIKYFKKNSYVSAYSSLIIFLQIYLIASWSAWWEGASYSARMLVSTLPFFGVGLANFLNLSFIRKKMVGIIYLFSFLNVFLILLFLLSH